MILITSGLKIRGDIGSQISIGMLSQASFVAAILKGSIMTTVLVVPCKLAADNKMHKIRPATPLDEEVY